MGELKLRKSGDYLEFRLSRSGSPNNSSEIYTGGVFFGPHAYIVESPGDELEEYHIVKVPGHMEWCGRGQSDYYETHYYIMQTFKRDGFLRGKMLYQIAPGRQWRKALVLLREKIEELQKSPLK